MPTNITLQAAHTISARAFVDAFNQAYRDYLRPLSLTPQNFKKTIAREAIDLKASVVALHKKQVVGTALLGIRQKRGWIGAVGVIPDYRQRGIARKIMQYLLEMAQQRNLRTVQLEVIKHNHKAHTLYQSLQFSEQRQLHTVTLQASHVPSQSDSQPAACHIQPVPVKKALDALSTLDSIQRSWSRDVPALRPFAKSFKALNAFKGSQPVGTCLFRIHSQGTNLVALAGTPAAANALLQALPSENPGAIVRYFNVPAEDPLLPELYRAGYQQTLTQLEMIHFIKKR